MLLPKTQNELMRWFAIAALGLLATCYLGLILAPNLSMHLATDAQEPALAGDWRGSFGHKNMAAAVMVMVLFIGIYVARSGAWLAGIAIVALASLFILNSGGKSSFALSLGVVGLTSLTTVIRPFWLRAMITLTPLVLLNLFTIGSVVSDQTRRSLKTVAGGFELHRPHRYLDLRLAGGRDAAMDRLRLRRVLGQRLRQEPARGHGMGGDGGAQP